MELARSQGLHMLDHSKDRSPGQDGVHFEFRNRLPDLRLLGCVTSLEGMRSLWDSNESLLVFLGKNVEGLFGKGQPIPAEKHRPISLGNTDTKVIVSAVAHPVSSRADEFVCRARQGFVKGRQLIRHLISLEIAAER